jgi:hypothetical protein
MKNIFLTIGIVFIIVNSVIGFIFSSYTTFNWLTSNTVILINTLFLHYISNSKIHDGFKVALSFILPTIGLTSFILSLKLENKWENNTVLVFLIISITFQLLLLIITNYLKTIKK